MKDICHKCFKRVDELYGMYAFGIPYNLCRECRNKVSKDVRIIKALQSLEIYGNKCQKCGEDDIVVLQYHHKNGKSEQTHVLERRIVKKDSKIDGIELLCANCHIRADLRDETSKRGIIKQEIKKYKTRNG